MGSEMCIRDRYNADPMIDPTAVKYDSLSYDEVLDRKLGVMDLTAVSYTHLTLPTICSV